MKILILQTARIGDTLQTTPLIRHVRLKYPDSHITVMIRPMSEPVIQANPDVDDYIVYHEDPIFSCMMSRDSDKLLQAYHDAEKLILDLREKQFDMAYNVTHSTSSALLLKLAKIPHIVGASLSEDWIFTLKGPWTIYFFTSVLSRDYNDLNLCDIFKQYEPIPQPVKELVFNVKTEDLQFVDELFAQYKIKESEFVACIQLGASETNKRWPAEYFARLARILHQKYQARIFLVGVQSEAELGMIFQREAPGLAIPLFGKTSLFQLAGLLKRSNLLITNDTGTMHLATAVKCPVMLVSVGYVHFRETGPYGVGNVAIELKERSYKMDIFQRTVDVHPLDRIQPEQVAQAIDWLLAIQKTRTFQQYMPEIGLENVEIHASDFAPDDCLQFYPLIRRTLDEHNFLRFMYRLMWLEYLNIGQGKNVEKESISKTFSFYTLPEFNIWKSWEKEFAQIFSELAVKYKQGMHITEQLKSCLTHKNIHKAREKVKLLSEIDEQIRIFGEIHHYLKPITLLTKYERDYLEGNDPFELANRTWEIYRGGYERSTAMSRKIKKCIELISSP